MEVRMQPRTEGNQRYLIFSLTVNPRARVMNYPDYLGNTVHHLDVPQSHAQLAITAEALVESHPAPGISQKPADRDLEGTGCSGLDRWL